MYAVVVPGWVVHWMCFFGRLPFLLVFLTFGPGVIHLRSHSMGYPGK